MHGHAAGRQASSRKTERCAPTAQMVHCCAVLRRRMLEGDLFALNDANQVAGVNFIIILQICALVMHLPCICLAVVYYFSPDFWLLVALPPIRSPGANKAEWNSQLLCHGMVVYCIILLLLLQYSGGNKSKLGLWHSHLGGPLAASAIMSGMSISIQFGWVRFDSFFSARFCSNSLGAVTTNGSWCHQKCWKLNKISQNWWYLLLQRQVSLWR